MLIQFSRFDGSIITAYQTHKSETLRQFLSDDFSFKETGAGQISVFSDDTRAVLLSALRDDAYAMENIDNIYFRDLSFDELLEYAKSELPSNESPMDNFTLEEKSRMVCMVSSFPVATDPFERLLESVLSSIQDPASLATIIETAIANIISLWGSCSPQNDRICPRPLLSMLFARCTHLHSSFNFNPYSSFNCNLYNGFNFNLARNDELGGETFTSLAIRHPYTLQQWRKHALQYTKTSLETFVAEELNTGRLRDNGWTTMSLQNIFNSNSNIKPQPAWDGQVSCQRCAIWINPRRLLVWEEFVEKTLAAVTSFDKNTAVPIDTTRPITSVTRSPDYSCFSHNHAVQDLQDHCHKICNLIRRPSRSSMGGDLDSIRFWDSDKIPGYINFKSYRTRELYEIYTKTGLCPTCAAEEAGETLEYEIDTGSEEYPPMLAPF